MAEPQNIHRYVRDDKTRNRPEWLNVVLTLGAIAGCIWAVIFAICFLGAPNDYNERRWGLRFLQGEEKRIAAIKQCQGSFKRIEYVFPGHHLGCEYAGPFFTWLGDELTEEVK